MFGVGVVRVVRDDVICCWFSIHPEGQVISLLHSNVEEYNAIVNFQILYICFSKTLTLYLSNVLLLLNYLLQIL
jgi:hypothetical protein